ncbi:MAG: hypothetical protein WD749_05960 [Phycisphaerales bacterium]
MLKNIGRTGSWLALAAIACAPVALTACNERESSTEVKRTTVTPDQKVTETETKEITVDPK